MATWVPVYGFDGLYSVSDDGVISSDARIVRHFSGGPKRLKQHIMRPTLTTHGYLALTLSKDGVHTRTSVHRVVLSSFSGGFPDGMEVRHIDGTRTNNALGNLCWGTRTDNMGDCSRHGRTNRGTRNPLSKLADADVLAIRAAAGTQIEIATQYGVHQSTVSYIKSRRNWAWLA